MPYSQNNLLSLFAICSFAVIGCGPASKPADTAHATPAKVEKLPVETELAVVTLTPDAVKRLGIETRAVAQQSVTPRRMLGGEAMVPAGRSITVSAPMSGIVSQVKLRAIPLPGQRVGQGEAVLALVPLLSPERDVPTPAEQVQLVGARATLLAAQAVAQGDVDRAKAEVEAAKINLQRAQKLFQDRAGAKRAVDDTQAQVNIAESVFDAATQRDKQLNEQLKLLTQKTSSGEASALPLSAPFQGLINRLNVSEGQTVASGAVLFEVVNLDTIWIRVPVFVDLLNSIQTDQMAHLVSLSGNSLGESSVSNASIEAQPIEAKPIAAPPTADAMSSTIDLYYQVDNQSLGIRPGQRVGVELPLKGAGESLVVPSASILFDVNGGTWVYLVSGENKYTRHRVRLNRVLGDEAQLDYGPAVGSQVVVAGAAELFGTEFGAGK